MKKTYPSAHQYKTAVKNLAQKMLPFNRHLNPLTDIKFINYVFKRWDNILKEKED